MQRTLTWLVCMICTCDLFSHFTFYAHDPKCLQRRHWHISKRRLTFRFLRCPLHCSHTGPSLLSCVCFLFGSEWDCHPGCHVATPLLESRLQVLSSGRRCPATEPLQPGQCTYTVFLAAQHTSALGAVVSLSLHVHCVYLPLGGELLRESFCCKIRNLPEPLIRLLLSIRREEEI